MKISDWKVGSAVVIVASMAVNGAAVAIEPLEPEPIDVPQYLLASSSAATVGEPIAINTIQGADFEVVKPEIAVRYIRSKY